MHRKPNITASKIPEVCHVAILRRPYVDMILRGEKTIESRLTVRPLPPYRAIEPGQRICIKISSGPYAAEAVATKVVFYDGLTPARVEQLRRQYQRHVGGDDDYWRAKANVRYATFITLGQVRASTLGPPIRSSGLAWFVLDDLSPRGAVKSHHALDATALASQRVIWSAGAIRNRYLRLPVELRRRIAADRPLLLTLPDGKTVSTRLLDNGMIQWRQWGPVFAAQGIAPGAAMRLDMLEPNRLRLTMENDRLGGDAP